MLGSKVASLSCETAPIKPKPVKTLVIMVWRCSRFYNAEGKSAGAMVVMSKPQIAKDGHGAGDSYSSQHGKRNT
jgi:hypothetical protein